jgi:hypothetical protein
MDSTPTPVWFGRVADGRLHLERKAEFGAQVARLDGAEIEITLRKRRRRRSLSQNAYYWGAVLPVLAEYCGTDVGELHEDLKQRFLFREDMTRKVLGQSLRGCRSTAELNSAEMTEYVEHIRRLAAEYGVYIPSPGEVA